MVASGLPVRNGWNHAEQAAKMALKLVKAAESFTIPHKPDVKLAIRVGINTGSTMAGVVGLKMPR